MKLPVHFELTVVFSHPLASKCQMVGHYLGEFSISYKPVKHGRPGIGATHSSRFIPLK
jgi:Ribosomal protein S19